MTREALVLVFMMFIGNVAMAVGELRDQDSQLPGVSIQKS